MFQIHVYLDITAYLGAKSTPESLDNSRLVKVA